MKTNSYILLIESTTTVCSVALAKNDEVIFEKSVNEVFMEKLLERTLELAN
jgi:hypothetical protein